jgi:hypothetical protein
VSSLSTRNLSSTSGSQKQSSSVFKLAHGRNRRPWMINEKDPTASSTALPAANTGLRPRINSTIAATNPSNCRCGIAQHQASGAQPCHLGGDIRVVWLHPRTAQYERILLT